MTKKKLGRDAVLIFILFVNYHCHGNISSKQEQNIIQNSTEMKSNIHTCIDIDSISFEGKTELIAYIKEDKEYRDKRGNTYYGSDYTDNSIRWIFPLVSDLLSKQGCKPLPNTDFLEKIREFFNLSIDSPCFTDNVYKAEYLEYYMYDDGLDGGESNVYLIGDGSLIFVPKYRLIYRVLPYPYSYIVSMENNHYYICIPQNIYHYNNYILRDSQSSLSWLIGNDLEFLEILLREFGYDKNNKINKAILNKIKKDYLNDSSNNKEVLINLFAKRDCKGKLDIRENLVKYITNNTTIEDNILLTMLEDYLIAIIDNEKIKRNEDIQGDFTRAERVKIFTIIGCEVEKVYSKLEISQGLQNWSDASILYNELASNDNLLEEINKEQYYKFPEVEETIKKVMDLIEINNESNVERRKDVDSR